LYIAIVASHKAYGVELAVIGEIIGKDMEESDSDLVSRPNPAFYWSELENPTVFSKEELSVNACEDQSIYIFNVHGSVHLGNVNVYIRLEVQRDAHGFECILYLTIFALHVSGAIYTHHQEHKLPSTAVGMRDCYGM
jgi:hypothetical protein